MSLTGGPSRSFEDIAADVRSEDVEEAREFVRNVYIGDHFELRWEKVMGRGARRTTGNIATYHAVIDERIAADPEWSRRIDKVAASRARRAAYGRAYQEGVPIDPEMEADFERMWLTGDGGFGEQHFRDDLAECAQLRAGLDNKTIPPSRIVGTGYRNPRKNAYEYLDRLERETREALATRGRSDSVNVLNVEFRARERRQADPS